MSLLDKASLVQIPSGYKEDKLYSVVPDNGDGDFTFARSSSATRVNSEGLIETASVVSTTELVTNGDFATDSDWNKGDGWSISGGKASNDGTSGSNNLSQNGILVVGKKYQITFTVSDYVSGIVQVSAGAAPRNSATSNGTYTFNQVATPYSDFYIIAKTFNGSIDNVSVKEVIENDVPRLDYSGGASCASLLLEPQRTNLITYSEDLTNPVYISGGGSGSSVVRTANYGISPDGTQNATRIQITRGSVYGEIYNRVATSIGQDYTFSFYAKALSGSPTLATIYDGSYQNIVTFTDEWVKYTYTYTAVTTLSGFNFTTWTDLPTTTETADLLIWGVQLEQGSYPTSYIPTSGSTATRTADVCNNAGTSATFNDSEGVLFWDGYIPNDGNEKILQISDGTNNNVVRIFARANGNDVRFQITVGGVNSFSQEIPMSSNNIYKTALKYKENDIAIWVNGSELYNANNGSMPSNLNTLEFNSDGNANIFYGKTKQLMVFNEALSDEELAALTAL